MSEFLTTAEVARRVGVGETTVRRWINTGQLDGIRVGRKLFRVSTEALEKFMGASA
jgi:excisionase family DNA binding protein